MQNSTGILNIEPPSHETHFGIFRSTSIFECGLWNFSSSVEYENPCFNLNYSKVLMVSPVRSPLLLEYNALCYVVPKYFPATLIFRSWRPLNTRQSPRVKFSCPCRGRAVMCVACWRPTVSIHCDMQRHLVDEMS